MPSRVYISGIGIISAIGNNIHETLDSLKQKKSGIGAIEHLDTIHREDLIAAEIKLTNKQLAELSGHTDSGLEPRGTLLALIAAQEAFNMSTLKMHRDDGFRTGVVSATTVGGMDKTEIDYYNCEKGHPYNHFVRTHECNHNTEKIADHLGARDYTTTISTACSSSANAILHGAMLIKHGVVDRVIAGGTDALSKFTLNGFHTLMILDRSPCRPFDENRKGLNLGEGAAYLVLESEIALGKRAALCELKGYANANDAYHQTASSPEGTGPYLAMKNAMDLAGLKADNIDYINAHGTGTENNDLVEGLAIEKIFGHNIPPISSTKPYTGHTLGAAGAVEAIISILALQHQLVFPNMNFKNSIEGLKIEPVKDVITDKNINHVLSNSFGFGGNDSSLIFSKI